MKGALAMLKTSATVPVMALLVLGAAPRHAEAATTKLCFTYPGTAYEDASPHFENHSFQNCTIGGGCADGPPGSTVSCVSGSPVLCEYDFGEDRGFTTNSWKFRRALALVTDANGVARFWGFLGSSGCTSGLDADNGPFSAAVFAAYESTATDVRFSVEDCSGSTCALAAEVVTGISPGYPPASKTTTVLSVNEAFSVYAAMAYSLDRLMSGVYGSGWHEFEVYYDPYAGNATSWNDATDVPYVAIGGTDAGESKYKPIHEMAHALQLDAVQPGSEAVAQATFMDCSFGNGDAYNHTVNAPEYSSCADVEGFAHYMSAATWNNLGDGADGLWMDWSVSSNSFSSYTLYDIETGTNEILNHCSETPAPSDCCGYGVEIDWARAFWDFRTDTGSTKPGSMDMLQVYEDAYTYEINSLSCSAGHYDDILDSVTSELGSSLGSRFDNKAGVNGADW